MRTIKFRAWDTKRNIFVPAGEIMFSFYGDTRIEVTPNCLEYIGDEVHNGEPQRERFTIEQFTGLKDKNGKDIYEGDMMEVHYFGFDGGSESEHSAVAIVLPMDQYGVSLHFIKALYNFRIGEEDNIWTLGGIMGLHEESFTYIGNIHENPELLTKKD